jgi:hypothetical protein
VRGGSHSLDLFGGDTLPDGFRYQPDFLSREEESFLLQNFKELPFKEFEFQGFKGKRRVVSFGWRYDFNGGGLTKTEDMPDFLAYTRVKAERFAALAPGKLQQVSSPSTRKTPPSAGTRTARYSAMSSGYRSFPPAPSAFAKSRREVGAAHPHSGAALCLSPARVLPQ